MTDDSPRTVQQTDAYSCGVFVATSALCLAAGYRVDCFTEADLQEPKKKRMVAEFVNGGFNGNGFDFEDTGRGGESA